MANTGAGKAGKSGGAGDKTGGSDTLNFTYSSAVEAALEQLEKDMEEARPTPRKKKSKKSLSEPVPPPEEAKSKQKIEVYKLNEIYNDLCQLRELNTPRTSRSQEGDKPAPAPPTGRSNGQQAPGGGGGANEPDNTPKTENGQGEEEDSPEERRKRERDKDDETGNKAGWGVKGT